MDYETIEGVKMLAEDGEPFLVIRVHPDDLATESESEKAAEFYRRYMGYRIVLAAKVEAGAWRTYGDKELVVQFDGDQIGLAEWETFELSRKWTTHT